MSSVDPPSASPLPDGPSLPVGHSLVEMPVAADLDGPWGWAYRGAADVGREVELETHGYDDLAEEPRELLSAMQHQQYVSRRRLVVLRPGVAAPTTGPGTAAEATTPPQPRDVVGHLSVDLPTTSNTHLGELAVAVRPAARGAGIGTALLHLGERLCAEAGRTTLLTASQHGAEPPPGPGALEATTGAGRVPADDPAPRFLTQHGYVLEQVERHSLLELPLPADVLAGHRHAALEMAGPDYRTHTWRDEIPARWEDQVAVLFTRMSTDPPTGGVDYAEDPWDAARVRTWVGERRDRGHGFVLSAAEHVPTGSLAAFTVLVYPTHRPGFAYQEDTLVLREHRGRRLGMLVKAVNLEALAGARPRTRRVHTWNAEENAHMLAINVALGFRPAGTYAAWQRRTATVEP